MALSNEDKKDVKRHFGGKMANKVARATQDHADRMSGVQHDYSDKIKHSFAMAKRDAIKRRLKKVKGYN